MSQAPGGDLRDHLAVLIGRRGPLRFDEYLEHALYHPLHGFYAAGGRAGRRGDFLTSPEVGPLFGAVMARALRTWWQEMGGPAEMTVVDAGAGPGALVAGIAAARPEIPLRLVTVERSASQRAAQRRRFARIGADVEVRQTLPPAPWTGVLVANELLDNMAFRLLERAEDHWDEIWVDSVDGNLVEVRRPAAAGVADRADALAPGAGQGARIPLQDAASRWLGRALEMVRGRVVVIDYASRTAGLAARDPSEWIRTYAAHGPAGDPLADPGNCDITCEVCVDQLASVAEPDLDRSQADALVSWGIGELVDEGRRQWNERAHVGDLAAIAARSRISEAEALCEPSGLGAFRVLEWVTA